MSARIVLFLLGCLWGPAQSFATTLEVMTSYPQPMVSQMQQAFEKAHPEITLNILWRRPHDAQSVLLEATTPQADVLWLPSPRTFLALKQAEKLAPLSVDRSGLPAHEANTRLVDSDGYYIATEIAGYGLFFLPEQLKQAGLTVPNNWQDLTDNAWAEHIALPIPSEVSFAHLLVDHLLQSEGWQSGWNLWQQIAANSQLMGRGGMFTTESVLQGQTMIAFTMDFFANSTIASNPQAQFIYPEKTVFNPAHVAILADAREPEAARQFVQFVLSEAGQRVLLHPDIRKQPVRPAIYQAENSLINPFKLVAQPDYDVKTGLQRREFNAALFDAAITLPHAQLVEAWQRWHAFANSATEEQQPTVAQLKTQLLTWPVTEPDASTISRIACEQRHDSDAAAAECDAFTQQMALAFSQKYQSVIEQLEALEQAK